MMVALLHSSGQLRTERYGDTEKGCQKPALYSRRLLSQLTRKFQVIEVCPLL